MLKAVFAIGGGACYRIVTVAWFNVNTQNTKGRVGLALMVRSQIIQSFVARIWLERPDDAEPEWRGHIRHIQGREETYFHDLEEMSEFMQQVSGIPGTRPQADPDKVVTMKKPKPKTAGKKNRKNGDD